MSSQVRRWVVWLVGLAVVVLGARLGFWQLGRAAQKNSLQQAILAKKQDRVADSIDFFAIKNASIRALDLTPHIHRPIQLVGRWLPEHTVLLDNRQMNGRPGFFVLTPLLLNGSDGHGVAVLVQRGWLPRDFMQRDRVAVPPAPTGTVVVNGRLAGPPARLLELGGAAASTAAVQDPSRAVDSPAVSVKTRDIRQNIDLKSFAMEMTQAAAQPSRWVTDVTVLQLDVAAPDGLLRQWAEPDAGVAKHHGYAFQWFALSALMLSLLLWFQVLAPRVAAARARRAPVL